MRIRGILLAVVAMVAMPAASTAWNTPQAEAAVRQAAGKKAERGKVHHRAVRPRPVHSKSRRTLRKVNFIAGRFRHGRTAKKGISGKGLKLASLLGRTGTSAGGLFSRKPGQIYDASGRYLGKTIVPFKRKLKPGTILIKTHERALYYVLPGGKAIKYGVGVGREGFTWTGRHRITMKKEWPEWRPPEEMKKRELAKYGRKLPDVMPGGPDNPLGARAMYIGNTLYRIHGTNNPRSIGKFVSSGCIRMLNEEVIDLYKRVKIGAPVIVEN